MSSRNRKGVAGWRRGVQGCGSSSVSKGTNEAQDVEFGRVYRWSPEGVMVECDCGERIVLGSFVTACDGCGANHAAVVRDELGAGRLEDEILHPWRYTRDREDAGVPY